MARQMNQNKSIRILSDFERLPPVLKRFSNEKDISIFFDPIPPRSNKFRALITFWKALKNDIIILNAEEPLLYRLCLLKQICFWNPFFLISVDLILRAPKSFRKKIICQIKGFLLRKVDRLILYHKDVTGYQKHFGISPGKCSYVPFKINQLDKIQAVIDNESREGPNEGNFVMTVGRSLRDINTFIKAMSFLNNIPGVILRQEKSIIACHGTVIEYEHLPSNVTEIVDHGSDSSFIQHMSNAKIIVIPRFLWDINATGISVSIQAMALKKCLIISHGPGSTELLQNDEAILVPPEDPEALARAIQKAWDHHSYREQIAGNGQKYALSLGDERRLLYDIVGESLECYGQTMY